MKMCTGCKQTLAYAAFPPNRSRGGYKPRCYQCTADHRRRDRHGMSKADKYVVAAEQDGCAICGRTDPSLKGWVVDHDRSCCPGQTSCEDCRRGVLCHWCNAALGYAHDDPETLRRMADYLELGARLTPLGISVDRLAIATRSPLSYKTNEQDERTNERSPHVYLDPHVSERAREAGD